jgi:hypothetical protein
MYIYIVCDRTVNEERSVSATFYTRALEPKSMPTLTVTVDQETLRWVRDRAAEGNIGVAHFVGDVLRQRMETESRYEAARLRFMGRKAQRLSWARYPSKDELHDRTRLR